MSRLVPTNPDFMHPISFKYLAKYLGLLLALIAFTQLAQKVDRYSVCVTLAAAAFVYGAVRVARHVVNLNRKDRHLGLFVIIGVQILAVVFTALFLSGTFAWIPFLLLEVVAFFYFAIVR
ncbi:MAG: hypothetical protein JST01_24670 [Cyanobacteria bacterium SZAS TMP-1]|nr:hypothetical protein [Cyanobacteria bacterium SZAS TMP-1]